VPETSVTKFGEFSDYVLGDLFTLGSYLNYRSP
jgi:hypothetical protein